MKTSLISGLAALVLAACGPDPAEPAISLEDKKPGVTEEQPPLPLEDSYAGLAAHHFLDTKQDYGTQDYSRPMGAFHGNIIPALNYHFDLAVQNAVRGHYPVPEHDGLTTYFKALDALTFFTEYRANTALRTAFTTVFGNDFNALWQENNPLLLNEQGFDADAIGCGIVQEQGTTNQYFIFALKGRDDLHNNIGGNPLLAYTLLPLPAASSDIFALAQMYQQVFVQP